MYPRNVNRPMVRMRPAELNKKYTMSNGTYINVVVGKGEGGRREGEEWRRRGKWR